MSVESTSTNYRIVRNTTLLAVNLVIAAESLGCTPGQQPTDTAQTQQTATEFAPTPTLIGTPIIEPTPTASFTPAPTETPQKSYNCAKWIDHESSMDSLSLALDIQSGEFARWVLDQVNSSEVISPNPGNLDYTFSEYPDGSANLSAQSTLRPGWTTKHSKTVAICKITPEELGIMDKNDHLFLVATVIQDKNHKRMPQLLLASRMFLEKWGKVWIDDTTNGFSAVNDLNSYDDPNLILRGAKPQGPDDLRIIEDETIFYGLQNTTRDEVKENFKVIAETDTFSDELIEFFSTTVVHISPHRTHTP